MCHRKSKSCNQEGSQLILGQQRYYETIYYYYATSKIRTQLCKSVAQTRNIHRTADETITWWWCTSSGLIRHFDPNLWTFLDFKSQTLTVTKRILKHCFICKRFRVKANRSFCNGCLTDLAGPLYIKPNYKKAYIFIFTCARAVHFKLVSDLTTESFVFTLCEHYVKLYIQIMLKHLKEHQMTWKNYIMFWNPNGWMESCGLVVWNMGANGADSEVLPEKNTQQGFF